ncbi:MAG: ribonuclease domain-containing protein [Pirellulaceae bacterium]
MSSIFESERVKRTDRFGQRPNSRARSWVRLIAGLVLIGIALYGLWQRQQGPIAPPAEDNAAELARPEKVVRRSSAGEPASTVVAGQTIYDREGRVAYEGEIDLTATIARIQAGERLGFPNDGSTFQNRERRLPRQAAGYYKEYVHPTPGLGGPGPQRIVAGQNGELYYTPDHYQTFRRLDEP